MDAQCNCEPKGRLFDEIRLDNGLTLYFYDLSRPIAGDRAQVDLVLHVPVDLEERFFEGCEDPAGTFAAFTAEVGKTVCFRQEKVRNFISSKDVQDLLEKMKKDLLESNLAYLSKPHFAARYARTVHSRWEKERPGGR